MVLEIVLRNTAVYYIVNIYIPSIILLNIGYLSFVFPLEDFTNRIMVTLTTLLVETTFFNQVNEKDITNNFRCKYAVKLCIYVYVFMYINHM